MHQFHENKSSAVAEIGDIQSASAVIWRGKKERRKKKNKQQDENIMVCPITQGDHNQRESIEG